MEYAKNFRKNSPILFGCIAVIMSINSELSDGAFIHEPMVNTSDLIGRTVNFSCLVTGVQESWEFMQWVKQSPAPAEVIAVDNTTMDDSKYKLDGYYNLTIRDIGINDDSWYTCSMGVEDYEAKLTVSDYPDSCDLYQDEWKSDDHDHPVVNLTCISRNSRPRAIISWFRGQVDITDYAYHPRPDLDSDGYGDTYSILTIDEDSGLPAYHMMDSAVPGMMHEDSAVPGMMHEGGHFYTCSIDLPGLPGIFIESIYVGAGESLRSLGYLAMFTTTAFTLIVTKSM